MVEAGTILGMVAAIGLLLIGMNYLPQPGLNSVQGIFSLLWLAAALMALLAFGRDLWRRERLKAVRKKWRAGGRRAVVEEAGERPFLSRQRERRLD